MSQNSKKSGDFGASELAEFRRLLEEQRAEVLARVEQHEKPAREPAEAMADEMDQASHDADQGLTLRILDKERKLLRELEHALAKFQDGSFGLCEGTGEPIDKRRLQARPWARYSLEYKELLEREEKSFAH